MFDGRSRMRTLLTPGWKREMIEMFMDALQGIFGIFGSVIAGSIRRALNRELNKKDGYVKSCIKSRKCKGIHVTRYGRQIGMTPQVKWEYSKRLCPKDSRGRRINCQQA